MKINLVNLKKVSDMNEQEFEEFLKLKDRIFHAYLQLPKEKIIEKLESINFFGFDADESVEELVIHMSKIGFENFDHKEIENVIIDDDGYHHLVELDEEINEWTINNKFKEFTQNVLEILQEAKTLPKELRVLFDQMFDMFYNSIFTCKSVISFDIENFELEVSDWKTFIRETWEITKDQQDSITNNEVSEENVLALSFFSSIVYEFYVEFIDYELPDGFLIALDKTEDINEIIISHDEIIMETTMVGEFEFFNVYRVDNEGFDERYSSEEE